MIIRSEQLNTRLMGLLSQLWSSYQASAPMSAASKGFERELFVSGLLGQVFPNHYRFASGDVVDRQGQSSGQVDIVLEYPSGFSFPVYPDGPRLFLAESVACIIEVKSDLTSQWDQVLKKESKVADLRRRFTKQILEELAEGFLSGDVAINPGDDPESLAATAKRLAGYLDSDVASVPFYVVGFQGWQDESLVQEKISGHSIDGVFQIENRMFVSPSDSARDGPGLIMFLEHLESHLLKDVARVKVIANYFKDPPEWD